MRPARMPRWRASPPCIPIHSSTFSFSLPQGRERGRSIVAAPFVFGGVSGKKRTHQPLLVVAFAPRGHFGLSPDVVPNPCFLLQFPVRVRKARRRTLFHHRSHAHPSSLHHRTVTRCGNGAESSVARRTPANHLSGQAVPARRRVSDAESGWQMAAVHAFHTRLESGQAPDRHLSRFGQGRSVFYQTDDVHEGQERDVPALVPRWKVFCLPVEQRCTFCAFWWKRGTSERKRARTEPDLCDAPGRRRGSKDH